MSPLLGRRRRDQHGRHRMDAHRDGARPAHDDRPGPVLRGPRAGEEHPEHVHDVHRGARGRDDHVGARRLLAGLRRRRQDPRRPRPRVHERRRLRAARRHDDPPARLLRLPGDVLHHHDRARRGRGRGAHALRPVSHLLGAVVDPRLRGPRALGLRRRLAGGAGHPGLRRRRARRDGLGLLRARGGPRRRGAQGLRAPGAAAAQRRVRAARRRPAVVRLVRLQRRQRLQHRPEQRAGVREHAADARPARC